MNTEELKKELDQLTQASSIKKLQEYIDHMIKVRGFEKQTPKDIMLLLTEEMGELAKEVRKMDKSLSIDTQKEYNSTLGDEIADVFIYILSMCQITNIDLLEVFKQKENKNFKRTWK